MNSEVICIIEAAKLLGRDHKKYMDGMMGLYSLSFFDWELGKAARYSYFFLRHLDEILDSGNPNSERVINYALSIQEQVLGIRSYPKHPLNKIADQAISLLEDRATSADNPRESFARSIDIMIFDYQRSRKRQVFTSGEIQAYHRLNYSPILDLLYIGLRSNLRSSDIPEYSLAHGRVNSIEDLEEDWGVGIINIPKEILDEANLDNDVSYQQLISSEFVRYWINHELIGSKRDLLSLQRVFSEHPEKLTREFSLGMTNILLRFIENHPLG